MRDTTKDKARALELAAHAARRFGDADSRRAAAMRFAADCGASLREISEATGVPHTSVKRLIDRS